MKKLLFFLGASCLAFGQSATSDLETSSTDIKKSISAVSNSDSATDKSKSESLGNPVTATYESKKLKKSQVYTSDGKLIQTSTKAILDERRLKAGEYVIKVDFQDGTSTSAKFSKK